MLTTAPQQPGTAENGETAEMSEKNSVITVLNTVITHCGNVAISVCRLRQRACNAFTAKTSNLFGTDRILRGPHGQLMLKFNNDYFSPISEKEFLAWVQKCQEEMPFLGGDKKLPQPPESMHFSRLS